MIFAMHDLNYSLFFRTVELVMLQLRSKLSKPVVLENLQIQKSRPSDTIRDNVAFIAKMFDISEFQNDTMEVLLREFKENGRRKREAIETFSLISGATYRFTQINRDSSGVGIKSWVGVRGKQNPKEKNLQQRYLLYLLK